MAQYQQRQERGSRQKGQDLQLHRQSYDENDLFFNSRVVNSTFIFAR